MDSQIQGVKAPPEGAVSTLAYAGLRSKRKSRAARGARSQPAFAAAFIARLCSRTFVSDSGETMSATERNDPSSP